MLNKLYLIKIFNISVINIQFSAPDQVVAIATPNWEGADYDWYIDDVYQTTTSTNEYSFDCEDGSFTMGVEIDYNTCTTLEGEQPYTMQCIGSIAVTEETLDQILNNTNKKIYIFNTNGQLVRSYSSNQVRHNALRGLSVGMYFVTVLDESSKKTYKLIVTR